MLGRFVYSLLPLTLTLASLAFALVSLFGSFKTNTKGLDNVFFLQLNFTDISVSGYTTSTLAYSAGIYPIYQIGAGGYCYGVMNWQNKVEISGCKTPTTPFWFDLVGLFEDSWEGDILSSSGLPQAITDYNNVVKGGSSAIWCLLIVVCGLSFIMACLGFFSACSKALSCGIVLISAVNALAALTTAALSTAIFLIYRQKINDSSDTFGATANVGGTGIGLIWGMAGAAMLCSFFWIFTTCFGKTSSPAPAADGDE